MKISNRIKKIVSLFLGFLLLTSVFSCSMLTQPYVSPQVTQTPNVDPKHLEEHVRFFSETLYPRNFNQLDNLNAAADYIKVIFEETSTAVEEQKFEVNGKTYRNIIAHFGPKGEAPLIIGAHYDSHDLTPGADDNASGVAGLLELAKLLKKNPPKQTVELIAYTLEEPPFFRSELMGSAVHARSLTENNRSIKLMISLEMIGYFKDEKNSQSYPIKLLSKIYPKTGNFIAIIGRSSEKKETKKVKALMLGATNLPVQSMNAPANLVQGLDFSDHLNYWAEGFPALMITDTAFFRNQNYHQPEDTADSLDYERMAKVVQATFAVVQHYQ